MSDASLPPDSGDFMKPPRPIPVGLLVLLGLILLGAVFCPSV